MCSTFANIRFGCFHQLQMRQCKLQYERTCGKFDVCILDYRTISIWKWIWYVNIWTWEYLVLIKCKYNYTASNGWSRKHPASQSDVIAARRLLAFATRESVDTKMKWITMAHLQVNSELNGTVSRRNSKTSRMNGAFEPSHLRLRRCDASATPQYRLLLLHKQHFWFMTDIWVATSAMVSAIIISWLYDRPNWTKSLLKWFFLWQIFGNEVNCLAFVADEKKKTEAKPVDK